MIAVKNFAKELEIDKVYLPKTDKKITEGLTLDEVRSLLQSAFKLKGKLENGVKLKHFWQAAIHSAFSTSLRAGDLLRVAADDTGDNGSLDLIQNKTRKPVRVRFSADAFKWIKEHGQPEAMPWPHTFRWFERCFEKLRDQAGVKRGTWKCLRRSIGSYADESGNGHKLLGNTRTVFESHFLAPEIAAKEPPKQVAI